MPTAFSSATPSPPISHPLGPAATPAATRQLACISVVAGARAAHQLPPPLPDSRLAPGFLRERISRNRDSVGPFRSALQAGAPSDFQKARCWLLLLLLLEWQQRVGALTWRASKIALTARLKLKLKAKCFQRLASNAQLSAINCSEKGLHKPFTIILSRPFVMPFPCPLFWRSI